MKLLKKLFLSKLDKLRDELIKFENQPNIKMGRDEYKARWVTYLCPCIYGSHFPFDLLDTDPKLKCHKCGNPIKIDGWQEFHKNLIEYSKLSYDSKKSIKDYQKEDYRADIIETVDMSETLKDPKFQEFYNKLNGKY